MKIYTRTGDEGMTNLFSGERVRKDAARVEAYGTIDELNSFLGLARSARPAPGVDRYLAALQHQLFVLGADFADVRAQEEHAEDSISEREITWMEDAIDQITSELPALTNFILPGGTAAASGIHVARTVCRRAERLAITLCQTESIPASAIVYLNRLSDFLFTLARYENFLRHFPEEKWVRD